MSQVMRPGPLASMAVALATALERTARAIRQRFAPTMWAEIAGTRIPIDGRFHRTPVGLVSIAASMGNVAHSSRGVE